jgi:hypothetical protein
MQVRISIKLQKKLLVKKSYKANLFFFALKARYKYLINKLVYTLQVAKSKGFIISESLCKVATAKTPRPYNQKAVLRQ